MEISSLVYSNEYLACNLLKYDLTIFRLVKKLLHFCCTIDLKSCVLVRADNSFWNISHYACVQFFKLVLCSCLLFLLFLLLAYWFHGEISSLMRELDEYKLREDHD